LRDTGSSAIVAALREGIALGIGRIDPNMVKIDIVAVMDGRRANPGASMVDASGDELSNDVDNPQSLDEAHKSDARMLQATSETNVDAILEAKFIVEAPASEVIAIQFLDAIEALAHPEVAPSVVESFNVALANTSIATRCVEVVWAYEIAIAQQAASPVPAIGLPGSGAALVAFALVIAVLLAGMCVACILKGCRGAWILAA